MTRKWIILIIMSLVTVVVWIAVEVSLGFLSTEEPADYQAYLEPLQPSFNEESLEEIISREQEYLLIDRDALE
jgi:hypothetical protein